MKSIRVPKIEMVTVPAGEFIMGRLEGYPHSGREDPAHEIYLDEYQIGRYPVTNAQYRFFVQDTGHQCQWSDGVDNHPASGLTWQDAWLFCAWMQYKTGKPYHLPTEAEWEKAATWNPKADRKQPYPWGDEPDDQCCNVLSSGPKSTTPVGAYSPQGDSPYGCADMIGNVDEWCNMAMRNYPYDSSDGCEELSAEGRRAIRGGDWYTISPPSGIRRNAPSDAWVGLWGFRVALGPSLDVAHQRYMEKVHKWLAGAQSEWESELKKDPHNAQRWYDRGARQIGLKQMGLELFAEAESDFTQALEIIENAGGKSGLESPLAWVYYNRAYVRFELRCYREAMQDASRAIELDPSDADLWMFRAQIGCRTEQWTQAERDWKKGNSINPEHPVKVPIKMQIDAAKGAYEKAIKVMTALIRRPLFTPLSSPEVHLWRGQVYERIGEMPKAMSDYFHYLLWRPHAPEATTLSRKIAQHREK